MVKYVVWLKPLRIKLAGFKYLVGLHTACYGHMGTLMSGQTHRPLPNLCCGMNHSSCITSLCPRPPTRKTINIMVEDTHEQQDIKLEGSYKGQNALEDRPLPSSSTRLCAQNMSKPTTLPEDAAMYPGLVAADASYLKNPVREPRPRAARQARNSALFMRLQSRLGQKSHLDGTTRK